MYFHGDPCYLPRVTLLSSGAENDVDARVRLDDRTELADLDRIRRVLKVSARIADVGG